MTTVRTRYAPSPTGYLHIGGAWMAFYNWLFARNQGGRFVVRIEDTDQSRSTREYETSILEDFRWLQIDWDEGPDVGGRLGPYRQTERGALYGKYAEALLARGAAYHCYCTLEELDAERARAAAAHQPYRYSGRCRDLSEAERARFVAEGRRPTIRLRIHGMVEPIVIDDLVRGRVEFSPADLDDAIIVRSDGSPLYNFANVIDDHEMGITHIIRGSEHLSNTPRQWVIYYALGWKPPQVAHLSNILGADRKKLSKRLGDTAVRDYRRRGFLPEAIINFFALMAWHPEGDREVYSREELVRLFRLEDVRKASPIFDLNKLEWLNGLYMRGLIQHDIDRVVDLCAEILQDAHVIDGPVSAELRSYVAAVINALGDRLKIGTDILTYGEFFFKDEVDYDPEGAARYLKTPSAPVILGALRDRLANETAFRADALEHLVRHLAEERGISTREIIHPARMALTGKTVGPGLFELMAVLSKERVLQRLSRAIAWVQRTMVT